MPKQSMDLDSLLSGFLSNALSTVDRKEEVPIIDFAENIVFNGEVKLFPQQSALLKAFYNEPLSKLEELELYDWSDNDHSNWRSARSYKNLIMECGRGASKSTVAAIIALYEFYNLITLKNPAKHFGLIPNDPIGIFVIAQTLEQVKDTLFAKIKGYAEDSFFFRSLKDTGKIEILAETIRCPSKNVSIFAKHTNSPALVGYTLKCIIIDELARFENRMENDGTITSMADELWSNVGKGVNRFGQYGRKVAISSAWAVNDPMERLREISANDPETLTFQLRTWDLNKLPSVSREACNSDYITNRAKAELEYECIRSKSRSGFIQAPKLDLYSTGLSCIDTRETTLDLSHPSEPSIIKYYVVNEVLRVEPNLTIQSYAHVDFSVKRDATALAICHALKKDEQWLIQIDGVVRWLPHTDQYGKERVVHYQNVEDVLLKLHHARNIRKVTFDSFNAESSIQKLHTLGIATQQVSTSRQAQLNYYTLFRDLLEAGLLILPRDSINLSVLVSELSNISIRPNGQVVHDIAGKDLADAVVNSVYTTYQELLSSGISLGMSVSVDTISSTTRPRPQTRVEVGKAISKLYKTMRR